MKLVAWGLPVALLVAACGTVEPGQGQDLRIETVALPDAVVGRDYRERNVVLQARGSGSLSWSLPQLPSSLSTWLSIGESTGLLEGTPLEVVSPSVDFVVQVTNGTTQAQGPFKLAVGCSEGAASPCGVPDPTMCVAGTRVCLNAKLGACTAAPGRPPYEADVTHCGPDCDRDVPADLDQPLRRDVRLWKRGRRVLGHHSRVLSRDRWTARELRLCLAPDARALRGLPDRVPGEGQHHCWLRKQCLHVCVQRALAKLQRRDREHRGTRRGWMRDPGRQRRQPLRRLRQGVPELAHGEEHGGNTASLRRRRVPLPVRPAAVS